MQFDLNRNGLRFRVLGVGFRINGLRTSFTHSKLLNCDLPARQWCSSAQLAGNRAMSRPVRRGREPESVGRSWRPFWIRRSTSAGSTGPPRSAQNSNPSTNLSSRYRGTSLIRSRLILAPCSRFMSRALWWSKGGWRYVLSEIPLYAMHFLFNPEADNPYPLR